MRRSSESRRDALCCAILCRSFNVLRKVDNARLKILREGVVLLSGVKQRALEKNKRTAHKSRASEKGTADEVVVVLLLSRELFFALFRAFVGVVRDVSSNKGRHLGEKVSIS